MMTGMATLLTSIQIPPRDVRLTNSYQKDSFTVGHET